jgi:hypothetical protein
MEFAVLGMLEHINGEVRPINECLDQLNVYVEYLAT